MLERAAPHAQAILASREGRRRSTRHIVVSFDHIPPELLAHQMHGVVGCTAVSPLIEFAIRHGWSLEPERIACPIRVVWGTEDQLLPWPAAAARYRTEWVPHADWVELEAVGHCPHSTSRSRPRS